MRQYLYIAILILGSISCRDVIDIKLREQSGRLVVEGLITDDPNRVWVKLSTTNSYYDNSTPPQVHNADVRLYTEDGEELLVFAYSDQHKRYMPQNSFAVNINESYTIRINYNGEEYISSGRIHENVRLDSVYTLFVPEFFFRPEGYYVYLDGFLPKDKRRFFRWMVYQNDTLKDGRGDYFIFDNQLLQEEIKGFEIPYGFEIGDTVKLESYSLNEDMFVYYNEFVNLLFNDGGVFSPPPVNPSSNVFNTDDEENYPLGFVQFSSYQSVSIIIDSEE